MWRFAFIAAAIGVACTGQQPPPSARRVERRAYADSGACPFECCQYGRWRADTAVILHAAPDSGSRTVGVLAAGDTVDAPTGFVRTVPTPLVVKRPAGQTTRGDYLYQPGETLWVYTYLGEGTYRARRDTGAFFEDMFEPGAVEGVHRTEAACRADSLCWAVFTPPTETVWWVQVRTRAGTVGWTAEADRFRGKDACSID
jgi:hypothetical protein